MIVLVLLSLEIMAGAVQKRQPKLAGRGFADRTYWSPYEH